MADLCTAQQRGGASAPSTFTATPTQHRSWSAPVVIFWTRVDRPPCADEVLQHEFGKAHGLAELQESSTTTSAGPARTQGSRGPLVVTASVIPAPSTHAMVRARIAQTRLARTGDRRCQRPGLPAASTVLVADQQAREPARPASFTG